MSNEFIDFGDRVIAPRPHSRMLKDLRGTTERVLEIARSTEPPTGDEPLGTKFSRPPPSTGDENLPSKALVPGDSAALEHNKTTSRSNIPSARIPTTIPYTLSSPMYTSTPTESGYALNGSFSPRLGYGLLGASPSENIVPDSIWSYYLVAGPGSFAMRLYLDSTKLILRILKGEVYMPGVLPSIGRFRFRHEDPQILASILDEHFAKMDLVHQNALPKADSGTHSNSGVVLFGPSDTLMRTSLRKHIFADVSREMGSVMEWLDPWGTQQHLSSQWTLQLTSTSVQISAYTLRNITRFNPNFSSSNIFPKSEEQPSSQPSSTNSVNNGDLSFVLGAQPLIQMLINDAICFGEGPRFSTQNIDRAVFSFLSGLMISESVPLISV